MPPLITPLEAQALGEIDDHTEIEALVQRSWRARVQRFGDSTDMCSADAKSGGWAEDCGFSAQSKYAEADTPMHAMMEPEQILEHAKAAEAAGAHRFLMVTHVECPEVSTMVRYETRLRAIDAVREGERETCVCGILNLGETRGHALNTGHKCETRESKIGGVGAA